MRHYGEYLHRSRRPTSVAFARLKGRPGRATDCAVELDQMTNEPEEIVAKFYSSVGWELTGEDTEDARRWEDLRACAAEYVSKCRLRVLRHIPKAGGERLLDMASGPIQYQEYLSYSRNFARRYCVDLSAAALDLARKKIGEHGVYLHGSFFDLDLQEDSFDCALSLHTIYHMDSDRQEQAVRKLLRITKPGSPVIIVYSNPNSIASRLLRLPLLRSVRARRAAPDAGSRAPELYFHAHPLAWWNRFRDVADVEILPWRSLSAVVQKKLIPDNRFGARLLAWLFALEDHFPNFFVRGAQYPMIVLTKRSVAPKPAA
jgi:SAM-dependent methyltransferase